MDELRNTNLWIVIDEETLETAKDEFGNVVKFPDEKSANDWASERLGLWTPFHVCFRHHWIHHSLQE